MDREQIESLLRDSAAKRRHLLGEPAPMEPARRRVLLDEARKLYRGPARSRAEASARGPLLRGWLVAAGFAAAVSVLCAGLFHFHTREAGRDAGEASEPLAASPESLSAESKTFAEMPPPCPVPESARLESSVRAGALSFGLLASKDESAFEGAIASARLKEIPRAGAPSSAAPQNPAAAGLAAAARAAYRAVYPDSAEGLSQAGGPSAVAGGAAALPAPAAAEKRGKPGAAVRFVNSAAEDSAPLSRFEAIRDGSALKIIDADSSVYTGSISKEGAFKVTGKNRTSGKPLVFEGVWASPNAGVRKSAGEIAAFNAADTARSRLVGPAAEVTGLAETGGQRLVISANRGNQ